MPLTQGQKLAGLAAVGIGAFFVFGGNAKASGSAPPLNPCADPKDCAQLTACANNILSIATKADVPSLNGLLSTARLFGCTDLAKTIQAKIDELSKTGGGTATPSTTPYVIVSGENPQDVMSKFGMTLAQLIASNPALKWGTTGQEVSPFSNAVNGSVIPGTSSGQIDPAGGINITPIFTPTMGILVSGTRGFPVYDSSVHVKDAPNNSVYFPSGKVGQPAIAFGPNPAMGRAFFTDGAWRWVATWRTGQTINVKSTTTSTGSEGLDASAGHEDHTASVAGCDACASCGHEANVAGCQSCSERLIQNPDSLGAYDVAVDRAFGAQFGVGSRNRKFGKNSRWGA